MSIQNPSQFDCDNMTRGDIIFVRKRSFFYKLKRKLMNDNKIILKVRKNWSDNPEYTYYYQEDCTLIFEYEMKCTQKLEHKVPCIICYGERVKPIKTTVLKKVEVSLYNIQLQFKNGITLMIPLDEINNSIKKNENILKNTEDTRRVEQSVKFLRYKGKYFKDYVKVNNIETWNPQYCSICGKPVKFTFKEDVIIIENYCECGNMSMNLKTMSYDQLAIWYAAQLNNTKKYYTEFWFK